jgi:hypothetical protein
MRDFRPLHEDRHARELVIPAGMVAVEVAIRDLPYVLGSDPGLREDRADRPDVHGSECLERGPVVGREPRVHQEQAMRVLNEERAHDDPIVGETRIRRRHRVVTGVQRPDPGHRGHSHAVILTQSLERQP